MAFGAQEKSQPSASDTSEKEKHLTPSKEHVSIPRYGPDSIHSWMTAGACFLTSFFGVAAIRASGFLYVAIVRHFNATRAEASWPIIVMSGVILLAGFVAGPIAHKFTARPVVLAGSAIGAAGLMLCYFATSIGYLVGTLAVFHGMGSGMVFVVTPTVINEHFIRYRGLAMGINFAGCCTASFVFPKVLEVLMDSYGFKGALLLFGAICLNSLAFSLFLRQPAWLRNRLEAEASAAVEKVPREAARPPKTSLTNGDVSATARCAPPTPGSLRHGLTVFSCPMFYVIMYSYISFTFAYECYISLFVDFATDRGVSLSHAVTMISVSSIADLVGRLALPAAADRGSFTSRTLLTVTFFHLGTLFLTLPLAWGYWWLFAFASAIAFCIGTSVSVFSVLVAEYLGIARQSMAYGMVSAFTGITSLFKPFVVGYFRDSVGSYDRLFMVCGSTVILAAIIWTVVHIKKNTRRSKECPLQ
ncbi:monocarboxylate transporter 12-like isoform X2 [Haemaphysalis longicornis]